MDEIDPCRVGKSCNNRPRNIERIGDRLQANSTQKEVPPSLVGQKRPPADRQPFLYSAAREIKYYATRSPAHHTARTTGSSRIILTRTRSARRPTAISPRSSSP